MEIRQAAYGCDRHVASGDFFTEEMSWKILGVVGQASCGEIFFEELISLKFSTSVCNYVTNAW